MTFSQKKSLIQRFNSIKNGCANLKPKRLTQLLLDVAHMERTDFTKQIACAIVDEQNA